MPKVRSPFRFFDTTARYPAQNQASCTVLPVSDMRARKRTADVFGKRYGEVLLVHIGDAEPSCEGESDGTLTIGAPIPFSDICPQVDGVSTEVIWEHNQGGESDEEIGNGVGLSTAAVYWALAYELDTRSGRAA